jgi:hypothetical protein
MGGFSECGDATLWLVVPEQRRHARRRQWIRWAVEDNDDAEEEYNKQTQGYALLMVDDDNYIQNAQQNLQQREVLDFAEKECLTRRRKDNQLVLKPCSQDRAWAWQFNEHGILHFEKTSKSKKTSTKNKRLLKRQTSLECLWRNATEAVLLTCDGEAPEVNLKSDIEERVVQIALVRQAKAASPTTIVTVEEETTPTHNIPTSRSRSERTRIRKQEQTTPPPPSDQHPLPSQVDIAHSHASGLTVHAELKPVSRLTSLSPQRGAASSKSSNKKQPPLHFLKDTNPILLAGGRLLATPKEVERKNTAAEGQKLHETLSSTTTMKPVIRKIQVNPYIAASNEERWTDPLTGLVYRTDLCQYLGHERKESGRHTLVGVGQYMKTVFNIKVRMNQELVSLG